MRAWALGAALVVCAAPGLARAGDDDTSEAPDEKAEPKGPPPRKSQKDIDIESGTGQKEKGEEDSFGHGGQFGLRAGVVFGYKMDFRYQHSPYCTPFDPSKGSWDQQQKICGFGAAPAVEVALSFAPLDFAEAYAFGRFGFSGEEKTDTNALQMLGAGVRLYTMSDSRLKIFIEPALAYEFEGGGNNPAWNLGLNPEYKNDLVFHLGIGPHFDFAKAFGAYAAAGLDVGVLRSISALLFLNIGVQVRMP
jgi:hypothetical protein